MRTAISLLLLLLCVPVWAGTDGTKINGSRWIVGTWDTQGPVDEGSASTFADTDATPDVDASKLWDTFTNALTITDFDGTIEEGYTIIVYSKGAITFDCTASGFECGTADIVTASGDVTVWRYDGSQWHLTSYKDQSTDMGTDAGAAGGDSVSIDSVSVTDPDFVSTGQIDFTDSSNTVTADINDDSILEADLKAVDAAVDEECLTYESTTGDFEWQTCGGAAGNSFETHDAPAGTDPVADSSTDTLAWTVTAPLTLTGDSGTDTLAFAWSGAHADAQVDGSAERDEVCGTTDLSASCEINSGVIVEGDLDEDSGTPTDEDVLTYDSTGANFNWIAQSALAAGTAAALAANGGDCSAGEIPIGVDAAGAVEGCYEPTEADITDLAHTATAITDGLIVEADLDEDSGTPTDGDVLTYDSTGANFDWVAQSTLGHTTDTGPSPDCSGATTYQNGEAGCVDLAGVYQPLDTELTLLAGLAETTGNVIIGVSSAWESVAQPVIDCTNCISIPAGNINDLGDADGAGTVLLAEYVQTWTFDSAATAPGDLDFMTIGINHDSTTDSVVQDLVTVVRNATTGTATLENLLVVDNRDTDGDVTNAIRIKSAGGGITVALQMADSDIDNAFGTDSATISMTELEILDGGTRTDEALCTYESTNNEIDCANAILGTPDFGGATSFEIVNSATPTTDATGEIALDTTITDHQPLFQYEAATTQDMTIIAIDTAELPATDNEIIKYDAATDKFVLEADGGAGGGGATSIMFRTPFSTGTTGGSPANDTCLCYLYAIPVTITDVDNFEYSVQTADVSAGIEGDFGIYSFDGATQYFECAMDVSTATIKVCANDDASPSSLDAGDYWICLAVDDDANNAAPRFHATNNKTDLRGCSFNQACTDGEMPATLTTPSCTWGAYRDQFYFGLTDE